MVLLVLIMLHALVMMISFHLRIISTKEARQQLEILFFSCDKYALFLLLQVAFFLSTTTL